ncbi:MAG: RNA methyltransferase, partial [Betaproteobacteria bacterium]
MERITSSQNLHFKQARTLAGSARERRKTRQMLMDGTRLIGTYAAHFGLDDCMLLVSEQGANRPAVQKLFESAPPRSTHILSDHLFVQITQVETPEGIVAVANIPRVEEKPSDDFRIVLDGVQDPGNLGGLLRTAAAAGATSVYLGKGCADAWSPKSLRGGMGAQFVLPLCEHVDLNMALAQFRGMVISTSPRARQSIYDLDLRGPVAMIFGNEGRGLADEVQAMANQLVEI